VRKMPNEKTAQEKVEEMYSWMQEIKGFMDAMKQEFDEEKKIKAEAEKKPKEKGLYEILTEDVI